MSAVGGPTIQAIQVACTFPKGSTFANQHVVPINIGDVWCYSVEVQIPDGPKGNLAIALQYAGTQIVPWGVVVVSTSVASGSIPGQTIDANGGALGTAHGTGTNGTAGGNGLAVILAG